MSTHSLLTASAIKPLLHVHTGESKSVDGVQAELALQATGVQIPNGSELEVHVKPLILLTQ
jgi:hypothetical protein